MIFLPASFTASVFGMNVREINPGSLESITRYVWVSFLLTFVTTWIVIAVQPYSTIHKPGAGLWRRAIWPALYITQKVIEYFRSFSVKGKKTLLQENNISLGPYRGKGDSILRFDDTICEEGATGTSV